MKVRVQSIGQTMLKAKSWDLIHESMAFFLEKNDMNKYNYPVKILFERPDNFSKTSLGEISAYMTLSCFLYYKPKSFIIFINPNQTDSELLNTIFHEFTHLKQYCEGNLRISLTKNHSVWFGTSVKNVDSEIDEAGYLNLPWEIDARDQANKMVDMWQKRSIMNDNTVTNTVHKFVNRIINFFKKDYINAKH